MILFKCDRCGCVYSKNENYSREYGVVKYEGPIESNRASIFDLCEDCERMLAVWFTSADDILKLRCPVCKGKVNKGYLEYLQECPYCTTPYLEEEIEDWVEPEP